MEAHGVREFPPDSLRGRFVRARAAGRGRRRDPARLRRTGARAAARRPAADARPRRARRRVPAGAHPLRDRRPRRRSAGLGECGAPCSATDDLAALDDLYARLIWIPDGELDGSTTRPASTGESSASPTRRRERRQAQAGRRAIR